MKISYPQTLPLHRALMDALNLRLPQSTLPTTQWEWGRIASEFRDEKNYDFAEGAYSTIDGLLEAAMDDPTGEGKFHAILNSPVSHLLPEPEAGKLKTLSHVVVKDASGEHKIQCRNAIISAGAVESPAILLRSAGKTLLDKAYGKDFARDFGHVTDHYIFYVSLPFYYKDMKTRELLGGMKLQTDITFDKIDQTTALANISLDATSFLPRRHIPDTELPKFIIAYILPSELQRDNKVELNEKNEPRIEVNYAHEPKLKQKKEMLKEFAVDAMNKIAKVLDVQFVTDPTQPTTRGLYKPIDIVKISDIVLGELGPGGVAHEMGSLPMPNNEGTRGIVDEDLKLKYGWSNVHVCDLSVFPYSPAANPTLSLTALALRLSDHLVDPRKTRFQAIGVYNLLAHPVFVRMTVSNAPNGPAYGPNPGSQTRIEPGAAQMWKREKRETIFVYACECATEFDVQMVYPGVNAMIVKMPPVDLSCSCSAEALAASKLPSHLVHTSD